MHDINSRRRQNFYLSSMLLCLIFCVTAFARAEGQTELTAGVRGSVTAGASGEVIAGARVAISNAALRLRRETFTNESGQFSLSGLPPASGYEISIGATGFRSVTRVDVTLASSEGLTIDAPLEIEEVNASVNVADAQMPVVSDAPEVSQIVNARQVAELPSNGRSLNRFALLDPHVRNTGGLGADGSTSARLSINAGSYRQTFYKLDGNSNYDFVYANAAQQQVSLSAVQEFKVLTNQYSAEYGGSSAGIVSTVTKAGTQDFHGEGFTFLRPSGIQAAPPVSTLHVPNQLFQFGGAVSGPLFGIKRATFFASYEETLARRGAFIQSPAPLTYVGNFRDYLGFLRFDYSFNDEHSLSLRVNGNRNTNGNSNDRVSGIVQQSAAQLSKQQSAGAQVTDRATRGTVVNELRFSYVNSIPSATSALRPQVSILRPNYATEGGSAYSWVRTQSFQFADQLAFQRGHHDLKIGADYARQKADDFSQTQFGEYRFSPTAAPASQTPLEFTQKFGDGFVRYGQTLFSAFVQDNWRATSRLTANLGLRYDYQSITDDRHNFSPRVGIAFDIKGDGKTIVRGGAGVFYDQYYMYITRRFLLEGVAAKIKTYRFAYGAAGSPVFPNSLAAEPTAFAEATRDYVYLPASRLHNPYSMQFSLGAQRQLFKDWTLTFDAIHARTLRQMRVNDINAPAPFIRTAPGQIRTIAAADATRPFGTSYAGVSVRKVAVIENTASSNYDALEFGLVRRFANRYQFEAHYVYSSALTYAMFFGEADTGVPNLFGVDERLDRAPSDFHQRHRFVAHGLVELPRDAQVSFVVTIGSGLPVNPVTGVDNDGDGYKTDRPVGFSRNSFRTPMQATFDVSLARRFRLSEGVRLELRAEAFNLFNRANFIKLNNIYGNASTPRADFLTPMAGVQNSDPGRQFQIGARFIF